MGRPKKQSREPFWRSFCNCWYVHLGGKQHRLSTDKKEAWRLWHELMARPPEEPKRLPIGQTALVIELLDAFLEWTKTNQAPKTYKWYLDHIQTFTNETPAGLTVAELKPYHVTAVMDGKATWSNSTKNGFGRSIQRGMKWAEKQGLIERTPIAHVEKPAGERREVIITPDDYADLLKRFPDQAFRDLLISAWETGSRPNELFKVGARHVDLKNKRWVFKIKESKGKIRSREVYLSDSAMEITTRLMKDHPTGPFLRNADGEPWMKDTVNRRFLRKKKALGRKISLYDFRHAFCQRLLLEGKDVLTVSLLMGHTSPAMVMRHYSHLQREPAFLRSALVRPASLTKP